MAKEKWCVITGRAIFIGIGMVFLAMALASVSLALDPLHLFSALAFIAFVLGSTIMYVAGSLEVSLMCDSHTTVLEAVLLFGAVYYMISSIAFSLATGGLTNNELGVIRAVFSLSVVMSLFCRVFRSKLITN